MHLGAYITPTDRERNEAVAPGGARIPPFTDELALLNATFRTPSAAAGNPQLAGLRAWTATCPAFPPRARHAPLLAGTRIDRLCHSSSSMAMVGYDADLCPGGRGTRLAKIARATRTRTSIPATHARG